MKKKEKLYLVSSNDLVKNLGSIKDNRLRRCMTNFIIQFDMNSWSKPYDKVVWDNFDLNTKPDSYGTFSTKGMPSYNEYITEQKFDDILDEFINGLLSMSVSEKSEFLRSLEKLSEPLKKKESSEDNIYNIINTIYYNHSDNDLFNSVKVSKIESTGTIVLSSYHLSSIEKLKAKLNKEGITDIKYRIIKNPYNNKKIHTIMYDRIGEK